MTAETCPPHLTLTQADIERCGAFAKCNPPLRGQGCVDVLCRRIASGGGIDVTGSDHSAYPQAAK